MATPPQHAHPPVSSTRALPAAHPAVRSRARRLRRRRALADLTITWAILYAGLRAWYATGHRPNFVPLETDLVLFTGWSAIVLPAAAAVVAIGLRRRHRWSRGWWLAGWAVTAAIGGACALVLLDLVGFVLWGIGIPHNPVSVASRLGCLAGGVLLAALTTDHRHVWHGDCARCGHAGNAARWQAMRAGPAPRWAKVAAYLAVAGMVTRLAAQALIGFGETPFAENASTLGFDVGFVLAGSVLPLALVRRWGRVWPRWVLPLAGRTVPRWLVAGPALVLAAGLTAYFGVGSLQLLTAPLTGTGTSADTSGLPPVFFWVAVPAYLVWGLAMGAAAISYHRRTSHPCARCGR